MDWNEKLIKLRNNKKIEEICDDLMLNPNAYEAYEAGTREVLDPVKNLIANYFGVTVGDIWD